MPERTCENCDWFRMANKLSFCSRCSTGAANYEDYWKPIKETKEKEMETEGGKQTHFDFGLDNS